MANKQSDRIYRTAKTKKNNYCNHVTNNCRSDEIALRDEILELKKQVLFLKKTNEKNFIKFRKYEDEVKRKDREIEELMDPRKNSEIAKVLSTKGAAILMNLKDQNNSLIQMVLNKDLQIKRLSAEIKMSKLYTSTKKNGSQAQHALRLKSLLRQLQDTLKESANVTSANGQQQDTSLEFSSSSEQSSPRELNDLMLTLQSLENYIKYSSDLLAKKNQEISLLTEETKTLRKTLKYKEYKYRRQNLFSFFDDQDFFSKKLFSKDRNRVRVDNNETKTASVKNLVSSEPTQNSEREEVLPHSAPTSSGCQMSEEFLKPKTEKNGDIHSNNYYSVENQDGEKKKTHQASNDSSRFSPILGETSPTNNLPTPLKKSSEKRNKIKEKWKKAWVKHKQFKRKNTITKEGVSQNQEKLQKVISEECVERTHNESDNEDLNALQNNAFETEQTIENTKSPLSLDNDEMTAIEKSEEERDTQEELYASDEVSSLSDVKSQKKSLDVVENEPEIEKVDSPGQNSKTEEVPNISDEFDSENAETFFADTKRFEIFPHSLDSSFESDDTPVQSVQVEVQINTVHTHSLEDTSSAEKSLEEWTQNDAINSDYDDDDDVVVK